MLTNTLQDFSIAFTTDKTPQEVFNAINNVKAWWSGQIDGESDKLNAEFRYRYEDVHDSTQKVTEFIPGKKVVWHVVKASINFVKDKTEWEGTDIIFEITEKKGNTKLEFTHKGLVPQIECYDDCSSGWSALINGNLKSLIETGEVPSDPFA